MSEKEQARDGLSDWIDEALAVLVEDGRVIKEGDRYRLARVADKDGPIARIGFGKDEEEGLAMSDFRKEYLEMTEALKRSTAMVEELLRRIRVISWVAAATGAWLLFYSIYNLVT